MGSIKCEARIQAPLDKVFMAFTDLASAPERIKAIKKLEILTPGPVGVGTRFRETRVMFGKEASEVMEIVSLEKNKGYSMTANSCGCAYRTTFSFTPEGSATKVSAEFGYKAVSFFAKLMSPLSYLMRGVMAKCLQGDLDDVKAHLEVKQGPA